MNLANNRSEITNKVWHKITSKFKPFDILVTQGFFSVVKRLKMVSVLRHTAAIDFIIDKLGVNKRSLISTPFYITTLFKSLKRTKNDLIISEQF